MEILVEIKKQYGEQVIHPVCATAHTFASIAGTKTLRPITVDAIKTLGYTVNVKQTLPVTL